MQGCHIIHNGIKHNFETLIEAQEYIDNLTLPRGSLEIVNAPKLFTLLNEVGAPLTNWREINLEICDEWSRLFASINSEKSFIATTERRVALLDTFNSVMSIAETEVHPHSLENFRATRDKQYKTFIYQEAMVGENICVETLFKITDREIAAGRMPHNHSCRNLALEAVAAPHFTRQQLIETKRGESENLHAPDRIKTSSLIERIRSWIYKR